MAMRSTANTCYDTHPSTSYRCSSQSSLGANLRHFDSRIRHRGKQQHLRCASASQENSFISQIAQIAKRIQGALPVVGLISRLAAPEGGFDELAYPEYCRALFDKAPPAMSQAMQQLEKKYGKAASSRGILLVLWMASTGLGLVRPRDIVTAARRLRVTQDIEVEIDRFEGARMQARKKYDLMAPPEVPVAEAVATVVDALVTLCLGKREADPLSSEEALLVEQVVLGGVPRASSELVKTVVAARAERASAY